MKEEIENLPGSGEENSGSLGNFHRVGYGETRGKELVAHYTMYHLAAAPQKHLPDFPILDWALRESHQKEKDFH